MGTPRTNGGVAGDADKPHQRRSVDGAGQTRSLSVDRNSGSGGGWASGVAATGTARAALARAPGAARAPARPSAAKASGSLTASNDCGAAEECSAAQGRLVHVHALAGHAGGHHLGHGRGVLSAPGRRSSPTPAARTAATAPRRDAVVRRWRRRRSMSMPSVKLWWRADLDLCLVRLPLRLRRHQSMCRSVFLDGLADTTSPQLQRPFSGCQTAKAYVRSGSIRADWLADLGWQKQSSDSSGIRADLRYRRDRPSAAVRVCQLPSRPVHWHSGDFTAPTPS